MGDVGWSNGCWLTDDTTAPLRDDDIAHMFYIDFH